MSGSVNGDSAIEAVAVANAANSQSQTILDLVDSASNQKAPFVRLADRFAVLFTVVAFLIAGAAWAISGDPTRFGEVLVVATPCPLLIAAPVAFLAPHGGATRRDAVARTCVRRMPLLHRRPAFASLNRGGRLILVSLPAYGSLTFPVFDTVLKGISIIGSIVGTRQDLTEVFALHAAGRTRVIAKQIDLRNANEAIADVLAGTVPARLVFTYEPALPVEAEGGHHVESASH